VASGRESAAQCARKASGATPCRATTSCRRRSIRRRHRSRRKRTGAAGEADETEETGEVSTTAPARGAAPPQHQPPVEATERRQHSTTGKLSEGTLKAMLEAQEQESGQSPGDAAKE
jgi:hypothetical protein